MPHKSTQTDPFLDELLAWLRTVPWWVGPPIIGLAWGAFRWILPGIFSGVAGLWNHPITTPGLELLARMSAMLSPYAAGVVTVVWLVALFKKVGDAHRLDRQTGIESIRALPWAEFEQLLAEMFRRQGYSVTATRRGADGGVDLILSKDGRQTLVQAKQWKAWRVGVRVVRELFGVQVAQRADEAIMVTSGRFTAEARRFAEDNGLTLIDGEVLADLIAEVQRSRDPHASATAPPPEGRGAAPSHAPACPACGAPMVQRRAKQGIHAGQVFWGCSRYPACKGLRSADRAMTP